MFNVVVALSRRFYCRRATLILYDWNDCLMGEGSKFVDFIINSD